MTAWIKTPCESPHSLEVGKLDHGGYAVRNTIDPDSKAYFTREEIVAFIHAAKVGAFDKLVGLE